jgi:hypothetical protein
MAIIRAGEMVTASDELSGDASRPMRQLMLPPALKVEFATLEAIWNSTGQTKRVDALVLAWVKYEKQLRRLVCFLVFQHPKIDADDINQIIATMAQQRNLYPETFIKGIGELGLTTVPQLLGAQYDALWSQISRIKNCRNKLVHGQITGKKLTPAN